MTDLLTDIRLILGRPMQSPGIIARWIAGLGISVLSYGLHWGGGLTAEANNGAGDLAQIPLLIHFLSMQLAEPIHSAINPNIGPVYIYNYIGDNPRVVRITGGS